MKLLIGSNSASTIKIKNISCSDINISSIKSVFLAGYVISDGGKPITSRGFRYGYRKENMANTILSSETSAEFHGTIELYSGTYFYQAFAINSEGESTADIKSFTI
jgi:hypothetical protein